MAALAALPGPGVPAGVRPPRAHYWSNGCFLDDAPIAAAMDRIADIPAVLIQGRYDVSGPLDTAWNLHRVWPASRLVVLGGAGHGGADLTAAVVDALNGFRDTW
jgi:proline iminopeptidase